MTSRIVGNAVQPLVPATGDVHVMIVGEAPGPRGADKSGYPFFGDAAGKHLYLALRKLGAVRLPDVVDACKWDGQLLRDAGFAPVAYDVSLTNAYNRCPTDDGAHFRAPSREELEGKSNTERLRDEICALQKRGLTGIVTLGKVAARTVRHVIAKHFEVSIPVFELPHPSAQGLLSMAPNRGKGARMADLQQQWQEQCMVTVIHAGYTRASIVTATK